MLKCSLRLPSVLSCGDFTISFSFLSTFKAVFFNIKLLYYFISENPKRACVMMFS